MLYLMRHGETDWNAVRRIQGHSDIPLNENGVRAMTEAGRRLKEIGFQVDRIAVSPLRRADQTARIIVQQIGYTGAFLRDEGYLSLPPQGNPLQVLERDGKVAFEYLLPDGQEKGKAGQNP